MIVWKLRGRCEKGRYPIIQGWYIWYSLDVEMHRNVGLLSEFDWETRGGCSIKGTMYCNGTVQSTQTAEHFRAAQVWWWRHSSWHWIPQWKAAGFSPGSQVCVDALIIAEGIWI